MGGVENSFEGTLAPLHLRRGPLASPRARRFPIPYGGVVAGHWMGSRRNDPGRSLPRSSPPSRGAGLRSGRPAAEPDRYPGAKHASRREGHLLPIVGVVRGRGPRHEVRPAWQLRTRSRTPRPRSTGDPRAGRRRVGEPERCHARAAARVTRHQANRSLLFHVRPTSLSAGSGSVWMPSALLPAPSCSTS
jgi:hypothetical protein